MCRVRWELEACRCWSWAEAEAGLYWCLDVGSESVVRASCGREAEMRWLSSSTVISDSFDLHFQTQVRRLAAVLCSCFPRLPHAMRTALLPLEGSLAALRLKRCQRRLSWGWRPALTPSNIERWYVSELQHSLNTSRKQAGLRSAWEESDGRKSCSFSQLLLKRLLMSCGRRGGEEDWRGGSKGGREERMWGGEGWLEFEWNFDLIKASSSFQAFKFQ
ncbi:MAG: hypothetical protein ACKERG_03700 [Candidatus Hodgkinia cicadicola]